MLSPEILNLIGGTLIGGVFKLVAQWQENQRWLVQAAIQKQEAADASHDRAAARAKGAGGEWTRRIIVLAVLFTVFLAPFILAAWIPEVPIFYAYAEEKGGFWIFASSVERMKFVRCDGFVLLPIHTQMAAAIAGFYFGAGIVKR